MTNLSTHKSILGNAIRVVTKNIIHAQTISMGVWINVGARDESDDEGGLSHFIEHMIFKGTASRTAYQIAKELDAIGGQANAFTAMEHSCFYARFYHTHLDNIISILFDILLSSSFDPKEIDRERQVILQELKMMQDDSEDYVNYLLGQAYWGKHPLGRSILGEKERIESFDSKTIRKYFRERYSSDKIVIALAGKVEHKSIVERLEKAFGKVRNLGNFINRKKPVPNPKKIFHYRDQEQVQVSLGGKGFPLDSSKRYIFTLLNIIIGGNMSSLLFQEIRERNALAYSVYAIPQMFSDCGMQNICMGLEPTKVNEALKLVRQTLNTVINKKIAESNLIEAKEYSKATIQLSEESINNQMVRLGQNELFYGRYIPLNEILNKIDCITPDDIQDMAQDILDIDKMAMAFLGPIDEDSITV